MENTQGIREVSEISPDPCLHVFRRTLSGLEEFESIEVDAYLLLGERYAIIFDTLLCPADMAAMMDRYASDIEQRQLLCVNSHADWDHTWGNGYFSQARHIPILAHEHCLQRMNSLEARQGLMEYQERYTVFQDVRLVPPTLTFREHMTIVDGDLTIELIHAPGHCLDQIVAWLPALQLLLAFDAVEKPLPCIENAACAPLMFDTLQRLTMLQAHTVLCSHGNTRSPDLIHENLAYLREIKRRCQLALQDKGDDPAPLAERIGYPFEEVIANATTEIDRTYYSWAHEQNVQAIAQWLLTDH